jgi:hypothetical protein
MKILDKVQEVFNRHQFKPIDIDESGIFPNIYLYLRSHPEMKKLFEPEKNDGYLLRKYKDHIPRGWYGFDIGEPTVPVWSTIIDEILDICLEADPKFEIHQIKMKFGGIRFYCNSELIEDLHEVESLIDNTLWDKALIY